MQVRRIKRATQKEKKGGRDAKEEQRASQEGKINDERGEGIAGEER